MTAGSGHRILQFGTSRFLQAHVDLLAHEARAAGRPSGTITVVKTTPGGGRDVRLSGLVDPAGYPVIIRGLEQDSPIEREVRVTSVTRALALHEAAEAVRSAMLEADIIVSNTADAGFEIAGADRRPGLAESLELPVSFPAKFLQLLAHRWRHRPDAPLAVFPCELIHRNGHVLKTLLAGLAQQTGADPGFIAWLDGLPFADSLVDRIVSEPIEPAGAVAEPYALWAIGNAPGLPRPIDHPSVIMTDDLERYERLKLHILNLGHTVLADLWAATSRPRDETVLEILSDPDVAAHLDLVYRTEIVPGFAARGLEDVARDYVATTLGRFRNPYLRHRLAEIHGNHAQKIERRIAAFLTWARAAGASHPMPVLEAIAAQPR